VAWFKYECARRTNEERGTPCAGVWQRNYYGHVVRDEKELNLVRRYVRRNPLKWALDRANPSSGDHPMKPMGASEQEYIPSLTEAGLVAALAQEGLLTARVRTALALAARAHARDRRDEGTPYLEEHIYPVAGEVAAYVARVRPAEAETAVLVALLHDTLEDSPTVSAAEIERALGREVADCVRALTKPAKAPNADPATRAQREATYEQAVARAPWAARVVKVFDRLNNLACLPKSSAEKRREYLAETRAFHLGLARSLDPTLGERMARRLRQLAALDQDAGKDA